MAGITKLARPFFLRRVAQCAWFADCAKEIQERQLLSLLKEASPTEYGRKYRFAEISGYQDYKQAVPLVRYEDIRPLVMRMVGGESGVLWKGRVRNYAQSSGTSDGKFANELHKDGVVVGDLSANLIDNINPIVNLLRVPPKKVALMEVWDKKLPALVEASRRKHITNISGVPSWFLSVLKEVMRREGVDCIHDVWPDLEVFFHGGISFAPYREQYEAITDRGKMHYLEIYNASEGFFAVQSSWDTQAMLLLLDLGVFYEFIPLSETGKEHPDALSIADVEAGKTYELVISACNGLWRYRIGDTVRVEQTRPVKITIAGRTKHFINAFGEELMVYNADRAIEEACRLTGASVYNYTAAPVYATAKTKGRHEWLIEFERRPDDMERFADVLDRELQKINSDYEAKRYKGIFIDRLSIVEARRGLFDDWLLLRSGRLGGQRKIPRLYNSREIIDSMLEMNIK